MAIFTVSAGSWDEENERIVAHEEKHATLEDALADFKTVENHVWSRIILRDGIYEYEITAKRVRRKDGLYFVDCAPDGGAWFARV